MRMTDLIAKKRDGQTLTTEEILSAYSTKVMNHFGKSF